MSADIVICGAGIAGISAAYHLSVRYGLNNILLIDERPPLTLTSDKSTECYRNWWPGPGNAMVALMNRSIDLLEKLADETGNIFHLNRRGYLFVTARPEAIPEMEWTARQISQLGAGPLRVHRGQPGDPKYTPLIENGFENQPTGADLLLDTRLIHKYFPYLTSLATAALHVRRAGWFSARQMGMYLLEQAQSHGVKLIQAHISGVEIIRNRIAGIRLADGEIIHTGCLVNAAGPMLKEFGQLLDTNLPVFCELHEKVGFLDTQGIIGRDAPLLIWSDDQYIDWSSEERQILAEDGELAWLLEKMPGGVHTRPEGGSDSPITLMLWEYQAQQSQPVWPSPSNPQYPEIVLRGLLQMIPGLSVYLGKSPRPRVDGGYYTKTKDNRPIIGKLPIQGTYVIGALSGFGIMSACAAGELLAAYVVADRLPIYAPAFSLERFSDPAYLKLLTDWETTWQL